MKIKNHIFEISVGYEGKNDNHQEIFKLFFLYAVDYADKNNIYKFILLLGRKSH